MKKPEKIRITPLNMQVKCDVKNGRIIISEEKGEAIKISDGVELKLTINGLQTGENFTFDAQAHHVELNGEFTLNGSFRIETAEFDSDELSEKINSLTKKNIK